MNLEDDLYKIDLLKKLTTFDNIFMKLGGKEDELKKNQKSFTLPEGCKKVKCAAESLFGKGVGEKLLYALSKYEMNMSPYTDLDLDPFSEKDIDLILEALDDYPETLLPFKKNKPLKHFKDGYGPSPTTLANASITIYSPWDTEVTENKMMTIIHEIGHNIGSHFDLDTSSEWLNMSGWVNKDGKWKATKEDQTISLYGQTNPAEDFAESIVAYRYNPQNLKKRSPEKYNFIKKYAFQGIEYLSEEACSESNAYINKLAKNLPKSLPKETTYINCTDEVARFFLEEEVSLKSCLKEERLSEVVKDVLEKDSNFKNDDKLKKLIISSAKSLNSELKISDEDEKNAKKVITEKIASSIKGRFSTILGCENQKQNGWQNFISANESLLGEPYSTALNQDKMNKISYDLCEKVVKDNRESLSCNDMTPIFAKMIGENISLQDSKDGCIIIPSSK